MEFQRLPCQLLQYVCIILFFSSCIRDITAINCYKCSSDKDTGCTEKSPSGPSIQAVECENPNTLLKNWIASQGLSKYGVVGSVNVESALLSADKETTKRGSLKNVTACAYFLASTQNKATEAVDDTISKTRSFFGDKNANDGVAIQKWILRECVTVLAHDEVDKQSNRCIPVGDLKQVAKVHVCICNKDNCNEGTSSLKGLITETESAGSLMSNVGAGVLMINFVTCLYYVSLY